MTSDRIPGTWVPARHAGEQYFLLHVGLLVVGVAVVLLAWQTVDRMHLLPNTRPPTAAGAAGPRAGRTRDADRGRGGCGR